MSMRQRQYEMETASFIGGRVEGAENKGEVGRDRVFRCPPPLGESLLPPVVPAHRRAVAGHVERTGIPARVEHRVHVCRTARPPLVGERAVGNDIPGLGCRSLGRVVMEVKAQHDAASGGEAGIAANPDPAMRPLSEIFVGQQPPAARLGSGDKGGLFQVRLEEAEVWSEGNHPWTWQMSAR